MNTTIPCVLMRAGTSRGPFFLREWLPDGDEARDQALIGAIGASDPLQLDGVGGGSTLNSKVAIVSRSSQPDCDVDYLFAQVGVGNQTVDTRPNCGNMLSGVAPFAIEQGLVEATEGQTRVRVFNVNTRSRIDVVVRTPGRQVTYAGDARIDGVAGTAAPILLHFLDAWGAVTGQVFPTGRRIDRIQGVDVTCIDAAMPLMIVRAKDMGWTGQEMPVAFDANASFLERLEQLRLEAGRMMGLGDVSQSVIPKPVLVSPGISADSITSRYFTPRKCHASHAVTGAIGVATAFAMPGTVASGVARKTGRHGLVVLHPAGQIDVEVGVEGEGDAVAVTSAGLVRTARKIMQGQMHLPAYVFSSPEVSREVSQKGDAAFPRKELTIIVPTKAGGGNDRMARIIAAKLGPLLGQQVKVDNRAGANGSIAARYVATSPPDGHTLIFGYAGTHAMSPSLQDPGYDPVHDFKPVGLVGSSPTLLVTSSLSAFHDVPGLLRAARESSAGLRYASAGDGTPPHFAAELFQLATGIECRSSKFDGAAPALADMLEGRSDIMFPSLFSASPFITAGQLIPLAIAGRQRVASLPDVPTLAELGIDGVDVVQWYGLLGPAGLPQDVADTLNQALNQVLGDPEVRDQFALQGTETRPGSPLQLQQQIEADLTRWRGVVEEAFVTIPEAEQEEVELSDVS